MGHGLVLPRHRMIAPSCLVWHDVVQAIANNTATSLSFNSEAIGWDTDSMHDTVVNNTRITIRTPGVYAIGAHLQWAGGAGVRTIAIRDSAGGSMALNQYDAAGIAVGMVISTIVSAPVGTWYDVQVYQLSGGPLNVITSAGANRYTPIFWAYRLT